MKTIKYSKLSEHAIEPSQKRITDAGFDLYTSESVVLGKFQSSTATQAISTGIAFDIPEEMEGSVRPRSGISLQGNMMVWYGTVDEEYTGEVKVIVTNLSNEPLLINRGFKIAQIVFSERPYAQMEEVESVVEKGRGENGFGSSGNLSEAYSKGDVTPHKTFVTPEGDKEGVEVTLLPEVGQVYTNDGDWVYGIYESPVRVFYKVRDILDDNDWLVVDVFEVSHSEIEKVKYIPQVLWNVVIGESDILETCQLVTEIDILNKIK